MLKKILLPLLIILGLTIFVCTIVALKRDEFNSTKTPITSQGETVFVPYEFKAENNDTEAIAREARNGNVGGTFINKEETENKKPIDESSVFFRTYKFFAFIGYSLLSLLLIFFGRF